MADRPCDCLHLKSSLCSCQHCQWFCAGRDAIAISQARITRPKRHLPNAYEILVIDRSVSHGGWVTFGEYLTGRGNRPPTTVDVRKLVSELSYSIVCVILGLTTFVQLRLVTDRRTHDDS